MWRGPLRAVGWCVLIALVTVSAAAAEGEGRLVILDTSGSWRCHYTLKMPVLKAGDGVETLPGVRLKEKWEKTELHQKARWLDHDSELPAPDWRSPGFDDRGWSRVRGMLVAGGQTRFAYSGQIEKNTDPKSPYVAQVSARGKFKVPDPGRAKDLALSLTCRGGAVVYLNAREIARAHLPRGAEVPPDAFAEVYAPGERPSRKLSLTVPARLLRKGANVLAIEVHRAPYREGDFKVVTDWTRTFTIGPATCGIEEVRLEGPDDLKGVVVPNVVRPAGLQVWTSDVLASDFDLDHGDPNEPPAAVRIVGTRGGAFSGKVVVGSTEVIRGLRAASSGLTSVGAQARIPASAVTVRYAAPGVGEGGADARYLAAPGRFDVLEEVPPREVPVRTKSPGPNSLKSPDVTPVFGAVVPVWMTVSIPPDASAGDYTGKLTITADGIQPVTVPVELRVCDWALPDPREFRTFVEIIQSPETLAVEYDVPLWSDEHFALIAKSLALLAQAGNKTAYVPLICETNLGNAHSMVRWIRKADGTYTHDFSPMERYLDLVLKHQGRPAAVCFYVWETFLSVQHVGRSGKWEPGGTVDAHRAYQGRGAEVTLLDAATKETTKLEIPRYEDPRSRALWEPVMEGVRRRMKARGLEDVMMLGMVSDWMPEKETAFFFRDLCPGVPWASFSHNYQQGVHGIPCAYRTHVYQSGWVPDPSLQRFSGWKVNELRTHFPRALQDYFPPTTFRLMGEMNLAANYRGFSRLGGDFWPALKDRRGRRVGSLASRYPKSGIWGLNVTTSLLAPGEGGPVATTRLAVLCEGIQECEARIFIERVLTDPALRQKIGEGLAGKCRDVLDERTLAALRGVSGFLQSGSYVQHACRADAWWHTPGILGNHWFVGSDWQERSEKLYAAAAQLAKALENPK